MTLVAFHRPSWSRYRALRGDLGRQSLLRCLEYERLARLDLAGSVLDFGGGEVTNYSDRRSAWGASYTYESANIDPTTRPTYLVGEDGQIPVPDARYDAVLSLNTLEHVYAVTDALIELRRVLKPGGRLVIVAPFIFRVHGHPDDYHRSTPSWWTKTLTGIGFDTPRVEALSWGPYTTAGVVTGLPGPFKRVRRETAMLADLAYAGLRRRRIEAAQDTPEVSAPLAYFLCARRRNP